MFGQGPYRTIATLGLLAALVGLLVFAPGPSERGDISVGPLGTTGRSGCSCRAGVFSSASDGFLARRASQPTT